jgi:hypothetical protein
VVVIFEISCKRDSVLSGYHHGAMVIGNSCSLRLRLGKQIFHSATQSSAAFSRIDMCLERRHVGLAFAGEELLSAPLR